MKPIMLGMQAPEFSLPSIGGNIVKLSQLRGKKVLISLLRNAQCCICNLWVANTAKQAPAWKRQGLEILAIFESTPEKLANQFQDRAPGFPVLADADGAVHEAFGSRNDAAQVQAIVATGAAEEALQQAAACGFKPTMEDGANFFRIPAEILIDEQGIVRDIHYSEQVFNHMDNNVIEQFLQTKYA